MVKSDVDCTKKTAVVTYNPKKTNVDAIIGALKGTKYSASKAEEKKS